MLDRRLTNSKPCMVSWKKSRNAKSSLIFRLSISTSTLFSYNLFIPELQLIAFALTCVEKIWHRSFKSSIMKGIRSTYITKATTGLSMVWHRHQYPWYWTSLPGMTQTSRLNTLRPRHYSHYFPGDIFKCILFNENVWILIAISLKFVSKVHEIISHHWFRQWLGADQATCHYMKQ